HLRHGITPSRVTGGHGRSEVEYHPVHHPGQHLIREVAQGHIRYADDELPPLGRAEEAARQMPQGRYRPRRRYSLDAVTSYAGSEIRDLYRHQVAHRMSTRL